MIQINNITKSAANRKMVDVSREEIIMIMQEIKNTLTDKGIHAELIIDGV